MTFQRSAPEQDAKLAKLVAEIEQLVKDIVDWEGTEADTRLPIGDQITRLAVRNIIDNKELEKLREIRQKMGDPMTYGEAGTYLLEAEEIRAGLAKFKTNLLPPA